MSLGSSGISSRMQSCLMPAVRISTETLTRITCSPMRSRNRLYFCTCLRMSSYNKSYCNSSCNYLCYSSYKQSIESLKRMQLESTNSSPLVIHLYTLLRVSTVPYLPPKCHLNCIASDPHFTAQEIDPSQYSWQNLSGLHG